MKSVCAVCRRVFQGGFVVVDEEGGYDHVIEDGVVRVDEVFELIELVWSERDGAAGAEDAQQVL